MQPLLTRLHLLETYLHKLRFITNFYVFALTVRMS